MKSELGMRPDMDVVEFKPGDHLLIEGDASYDFFLIQHGMVEIFTKDTQGHDIHLATLQRGQSLGEFAFFMKQPRTASARAVTAVKAVRISAEGYRQLVSELPEWASSFIESLISRIVETNERIRKL